MRIIKFALAPLFLLVVMFCVYGVFASMEPTETSSMHTGWVIGYGLVGVCGLLMAGWLVVSGLRQGGRVTDDWED